VDEHDTDQWAPITDADLVEGNIDAVLEGSPLPEAASLVLVTALPPRPPPSRVYPKRPAPVYTENDWRIFDKWVHRKGFSIDQAAACAGIRVYDALLALEKRDPYYYEFAIMISPQGGGPGPSPRRRKGPSMAPAIGGLGKNYARVERPRRHQHNQKDLQADRRLTPEEACARFLGVLGDAHPEDRVDGERDHLRRLTAVHPGTGHNRKQSRIPLKKRVRFHSRNRNKEIPTRVEETGESV
jgi:hypothetical protein